MAMVPAEEELHGSGMMRDGMTEGTDNRGGLISTGGGGGFNGCLVLCSLLDLSGSDGVVSVIPIYTSSSAHLRAVSKSQRRSGWTGAVE